MLKAIIFDFDGVICESVEAKTRAFRKIFRRYPRHLNEIIAYHERNGGLSRFKKFAHIYKNILKQRLTPELSRSLGEKFSRYSLQAVIDARYVKGALPFLKRYHKQINFFVVSGTPQAEMQLIVRKRGLRKYFRAVYGSPDTKKQLTQRILKNNKLRGAEVVFVGDSINDHKGAVAAGVEFIGRVRSGKRNPFTHFRRIVIIKDIQGLGPIVRSRLGQ